MKYILLLIIIYLVFRFIIMPRPKLPPQQEPDIYIDHEEIPKKDEAHK